MIHADIVDLAYREDSNHRRIHTSQIEADDCFFGFGEKGGEFNKAQKYMVLSPGDSMGYDPKETDSLYKHIPFYIKLNQTTKKQPDISITIPGNVTLTWDVKSAITGTVTAATPPTAEILTFSWSQDLQSARL